MTDRPEFSTYQFFPDGSYEKVVEFVSAERAMIIARQCMTSLGARIGTTRRIIVTDGDDYTVFEWKHGEGITYPKQDEHGRFIAD